MSWITDALAKALKRSRAAGSNGIVVPQGYDPVSGDWVPVKVGPNGELLTQLTGSNVCLSTEEKPVGVQGDTLLEYNTETKETKVYKYISGDWREL